MNLQHFVGDMDIDLTQAANLKQSNIIVIRNAIGKTTITVPHRYQVKVDYTTLYGQLNFKEHYVKKARNERVVYETEGYPNGVEIKLFVSSIVGDLEVQYR